MSTRLFPTCCEIHEWLYHVSWRSVPSLLKYTSGVKIRGLQSVQPCWQTTPNTYLMRRGKLFFFYFLNSYASLLHTAPVHIQLYPLPSVCITSWKWREEAFLSQRRSPAWYVSRLRDWQATWTSQCVAQSGLAVGLLPFSAQAEAELTVDVPRPVREKNWAGGWQRESRSSEERLARCSPVNLI